MTFRGSALRRFARLAAAFAVAAAIAAAGMMALRPSPPPPPIAALVDASRADARRVQPRLSGGFAWTPFVVATRDGSQPSPQSSIAIEAAIARLSATPSPEAQHALAIAQMLAGRPRDAMTNLNAAAPRLNDADAFADLAAALVEMDRRDEAPELLARALAAADRALELEPGNVLALFNRALVLERLGIRDVAREAWEQYLVADPASGWSTEARQHRDALAAEPPFLEVLDREYDRVANDRAAAAALARRDPFGARGIVLRDVLGRWGEAVQQGNPRDASRHLQVARQLGLALARDGGDRTLEHSVATIDAADPATRLSLAAAHAGFRAGLRAFAESNTVDARSMLLRAAAAFEQAGSPMMFPARCFAANASFEQGRADEAEREQRQVFDTIPRAYPAYHAFARWQLGIYRTARGDWGPAIDLLTKSASGFERLGETENAASIHRMLAFIHDRIGDPEAASKHWVAALRGVGLRAGLPLLKTLDSIADEAIVRRQWDVAASFLTVEADVSRRVGDDEQLASALFLRAAVCARRNDAANAVRDLAAARAVAARVKDPSYRTLLDSADLRAQAMLPGTRPADAVALLTRAARQSTAAGQVDLPALLLALARARRDSGDRERAAEDLERGMAEIERRRQSLPPGELRWGAFHSAEELFEEAIDLALERQSVDAAFRCSERARARSLLEATGVPAAFDVRRIPAGTVIVEFASLPSRMAIFTVSSSGVEATVVPIGRDALAGDVEALSRSLRAGSSRDADAASARVHRDLIAPIAARLAAAATLVFVPDATTSAVPFSALGAVAGEYLVQRHAIVVAPSAAAFLSAGDRVPRTDRTGRSALVISSSATAGLETLTFVEREVRSVAAAYRGATTLRDPDAKELSARAQQASVIHFAGHAVGDPQGYEPASIILRDGSGETRLRAADIAELRLHDTIAVVLAGCNTARGQRRATEGVISVAYGFLTAGAPSVIGTLWPIDDEASATFFPRLHRGLAEGLRPADALREAQLECIRRGDVPVSLWAAVEDMGS